jgi:hypothetical protein
VIVLKDLAWTKKQIRGLKPPLFFWKKEAFLIKISISSYVEGNNL